MKIAVDAMGGDRAPEVIIQGAIDAVKELDLPIILVGNQEILKRSWPGSEPPTDISKSTIAVKSLE